MTENNHSHQDEHHHHCHDHGLEQLVEELEAKLETNYSWKDKKKAAIGEFLGNFKLEAKCLAVCGAFEWAGETAAFYAGWIDMYGPEASLLTGIVAGLTGGYLYVFNQYIRDAEHSGTAVRDAAMMAVLTEGTCVPVGIGVEAFLNYHLSAMFGISPDPLNPANFALHAADLAVALAPANVAMSTCTYFLNRFGKKVYTEGSDDSMIDMPNLQAYREAQMMEIASYISQQLDGGLYVIKKKMGVRIQSENGNAVELIASKSLSATAKKMGAKEEKDLQWEVYSKQGPYADVIHTAEHLFDEVLDRLGKPYHEITKASCGHDH